MQKLPDFFGESRHAVVATEAEKIRAVLAIHDAAPNYRLAIRTAGERGTEIPIASKPALIAYVYPMTHLTIKIGTSDFRYLREQCGYYVDKSLFAAAVIQGSQIIVLPRPRRFGKTLNMTTLRYFLDRKVTDQDALFAGLKLMQEPEAVLNHKGRHPVIYLTLKDWKFARLEDLQLKFIHAMAEIFGDNKDVLSCLDENEAELFRSISASKASLDAVQNALLTLSVWMKRAHGQDVAILIDEYDSPLINAWIEGYLNDAIKLLRPWFSAGLKDNPALYKGVLTGILRIGKENLFSGLNNPEIATVLHEGAFEDKFGFTEEEVIQLLADFGKSDQIDIARRWYNGYRFGHSTIYNPWSITHFAKNPSTIPEPYWVNTSDNVLVYESLAEREDDIRDELQGILEGREVRAVLNDNTVFADISRDPDCLWSFLVHTGYLKVIDFELDYTARKSYRLALPNDELRFIFQTFIERAYWKASYKGLNKILKGIILDDAALLQAELGELFRQIVSFHDYAKQPEAFIHGFLLALAANLSNRYTIESNRESGLGRADMILIPKHPSQYGIPKIFEFKAIGPDDNAEAAILEALKQIKDKDYAARCRAAGFGDFAAFALVQQGKQLFIRKAQ